MRQSKERSSTVEVYKGSQYLAGTGPIGFLFCPNKDTEFCEICCGLASAFSPPFRWKQRFVWSPRAKVPRLPAEALPGCAGWQRCADNCRCGGRQGSRFSGQRKVVVNKLCLGLLTTCQKCGVWLGLLKCGKKKLVAELFELTESSSHPLLSASCWAAEVGCSWWGQTYRIKLTEEDFKNLQKDIYIICIWT